MSMSDVLHHARTTPTQQAALLHQARFRANIEARSIAAQQKDEPVVIAAPRMLALPAPLISERERLISEIGKLSERLSEIDEEIVRAGPRLTVGGIQRAVIKFYDTTLTELISNRRDAPTVHKRQVAMYLSKTLTPKSLVLIGKMYGDRDHTTVLHAVRKIANDMKTNTDLAREISDLTAFITSSVASACSPSTEGTPCSLAPTPQT